MSKTLTVKKLVDHFNLEVLSGKDKLANTEIKVFGLNRPGLELAGFRSKDEHIVRRMVLMSDKESEYMNQFDLDTKLDKYKSLMETNIPAILLSNKFDDIDGITKAGKELDFPVLKTNFKSTNELVKKVLDYLDEFFAPSEEAHGSLVSIYGKGVLITGESGIGKSEVALELMKDNHLFVGDDRVVLTNKGEIIYGEANPILKNLIEVRGLGIIDVAKSHGYESIMERSPLDLIVELYKLEPNAEDDSDRLGAKYEYKDILGAKIPFIKIPVTPGKNIAVIIENAVAQLKLVLSGNAENVVELVDERLKKAQEENNDN